MVSHALGTVRTLCDNVAWLEHGVLMEVGAPGPVIDRYVGVAHLDRTDDGDGGSRWGSGQGRIERVELLGPDGAPTHTVRTGDKITIRMHYATTEPDRAARVRRRRGLAGRRAARRPEHP